MKSLFNAGMFFIADMLSTLVFVVTYAITGNIYAATGVGIGIGVAQVALMLALRRKVDLMQWMSLGLVVVFGSITLFTHDPQFIKLKPSLIYVAVGLVMLKPGWMNRYMPAIVNDNGGDIVRAFGFGWAGLMFATAAANAYVAYQFDTASYAWFLAVVPVASKLALFGIQYVALRVLVRRRIMRAMRTQPA